MCIFISFEFIKDIYSILFSIFYATFLQVPDNFILGLFLLEELVFFFSLLNL